MEHAMNGRIMTVETTQPGVQLYTANYFDNVLGKNGVKYNKQSCLALETQNWPDAVNRVCFFHEIQLRNTVVTSL